MAVQSDDRVRAVERIRKMLAMGGSANENEASAFVDKAHAEMARLQITHDELERANEEADDLVLEKMLSDPYRWTYVVAIGCARLYFCNHYYEDAIRDTGGKAFRHCFVGGQANVAVAHLMFEYLYDTVRRLARQHAKGLPKKEQSPFRTAFKNACAKRLRTRMDERLEQAKDGGIVEANGNTLPALLDNYEKADAKNRAFIEKAGVELTDVSRKLAIELSPAGALAGFRAGDEISLDAQVEDQRRKQIGKQ